MSLPTNNTHEVINKLIVYLSSFDTIHSDLVYSFYKEKVFSLKYKDVVNKLSIMYNIPEFYFDTNDVSILLHVIHKKFKEYHKKYMSQRDANATSETPVLELETIPLTLEKYTATMFCFLFDKKIGFDILQIAKDRQKRFFDQQEKQIVNTHLDESDIFLSNIMPDNNTKNDPYSISNEEIMKHTNVIQSLVIQYLESNVSKDLKYILELKLKFPH